MGLYAAVWHLPVITASSEIIRSLDQTAALCELKRAVYVREGESFEVPPVKAENRFGSSTMK